MMSTRPSRRISALLLSAMFAFGALGLAGCGDDTAPNEDAQPEPEQPMSQGPMSNENAGEAPSDDL